MKKKSVPSILIATVLWLIIYLLTSTSGLIHPACFAYGGTAAAFFLSFIYLLMTANMRSFGAPIILNGFALLVAFALGEVDLPLIIGLVVLTALAEIIRNRNGYDTLKGVRLSFIPLAYSFYAYAAHWWTDTDGALAAAAEEMPAGYADKMVPVIHNIPVLIIMLILVIPIAIFSMKLAEKVMKKQSAALKQERRR